MFRCASASAASPLAQYAQSLAGLEAEGTGAEADGAPMHFPTFTVALEALLRMAEVRPHEELMAAGLLVEFRSRIGKAAFVSHQCV